MNTTQLHDLTLEQFLALPEGETAFELVDGRAIAKVSPKYFHSSLQKTLLRLIEICCQGKGRILPEWAVMLQRDGKDWVPTPDLTYVSYDRLPKQWKRNEACPVPCTLAIEIVSPGQTFAEFEQKATDYLNAGCDRVWVVEPEAIKLTAFFPSGERVVYEGDLLIEDELLPGFSLSIVQIWTEAELS
jgi:Uma2 family endonuclease